MADNSGNLTPQDRSNISIQLKEDIAKKISQLLIEDYDKIGTESLAATQRVIRDGVIVKNRGANDEIVIFQSDVKANPADMNLIDMLAGVPVDPEKFKLHFDGGMDGNTANVYLELGDNHGRIDISGLWNEDEQGNINPMGVVFEDNTGQFVEFDEKRTNIDLEKAKEILDYNIFELLPKQITRQSQIDKFFAEYNKLKGPKPGEGGLPNFGFDADDNGDFDTFVDEETYDEYTSGHDISTAQESGQDDSAKFITRLEGDSNDTNVNKTLQWLRDDLNAYLKDVDVVPTEEVVDERPNYTNQSPGYIKIRHLNQGFIVRKQEGDDIGIEEIVSGTVKIGSTEVSSTGPSYLIDGFTVTIWVKFLDRVNNGTLFNYGNPLRNKDPKGFRIETFVLNKDEVMTDGEMTWGEFRPSIFVENDYARFIRLVVADHTHPIDNPVRPRLYDSSLGMIDFPKKSWVSEFGNIDDTNALDYGRGHEKYLVTHTQVPVDFDEWFFVCATFDPMVNDMLGTLPTNPDYWTGNMTENGGYTHYSGLGSKAKVEVISRRDLLRARGFKV